MLYRWYVYGQDGIEDAFAIRRKVFCGEVGFSEEFEFDDLDRESLHLVLYREGAPVCTARINRESEGAMHFGRLCAPADERGKGYGKLCLDIAVKKCLEMGAEKVTLGAKYDKRGFYRKAGFETKGEVYEEEEIPHISMEKTFFDKNKARFDRGRFDIPHHANLFALIYRRAEEMCGEKGAAAADEGTKLYGRQRGARMRERAIFDKNPLSMESYLLYGEWVDKNGRSKNDPDADTYPVYTTNVLRCGWCEAWKESGLLPWGKNYCTYADKNLVKGFNPRLTLDIEKVLSQGGDTCLFLWNGFSMKTRRDKRRFSEKAAGINSAKIKDFLYHTGHLLSAMRTALRENLGGETADKIIDKALYDYCALYGEEMTEAVKLEAWQDFTVFEY